VNVGDGEKAEIPRPGEDATGSEGQPFVIRALGKSPGKEEGSTYPSEGPGEV